MARIAIIGAGLSGLVAARRLASQHDVVVYEKSRGLGGRMATRYAGEFEFKFEFDHGTQFFIARSSRFRQYLAPLIEAGVVALWNARFLEISHDGRSPMRTWDEEFPHYVGTPRMNAVGAWLAESLDIRKQTRVTKLERQSSGWKLMGPSGELIDKADWIILTAPAAQTAELAPSDSVVHRHASTTQMSGCCALMLGLAVQPELGFDAALVRDSDISWISVNSSKPGRGDAPTLVVHSTNAWAEANQDLADQEVVDEMLAQLASVTSLDTSSIVHRGLQRWRYANIPKQKGPDSLIDNDWSIAACGDWFIRGRVESAFRSADALCRKLEILL